MDITGFIASILIDVSLGLSGGGGNILAVPVLVYLFNLDALFVNAYLILIVTSTILIGSLSHFKKGLENIKALIKCGMPSITILFLTNILPTILQNAFVIGSLTVLGT